jgi:hypothetical protein
MLAVLRFPANFRTVGRSIKTIPPLSAMNVTWDARPLCFSLALLAVIGRTPFVREHHRDARFLMCIKHGYEEEKFAFDLVDRFRLEA